MKTGLRSDAVRAGLRLLAALCLLAAPTRAFASGPVTDALVDHVLAAYGGKAALAKVASYRMEGTVDSVMRGKGPFVRTFSRPDHLKIVLDYPGHRETRILHKDHGWRSDDTGKMLPADSFLLTSMMLQAARANLPWLLDEHRRELVALGPMDGGRLRGVELTLGNGLVLTAYIEAATGRIVRSSGVLSTPTMKTNFATEYADFRAVDGVLFPFRESNFASNQSTGETVVTKVAVNPPLPDAEFQP